MQRTVWKFLLLALALGGLAVAAWYYVENRRFTRQWDPAEVGRLENFRYAQQKIEEFEASPEADRKQALLVAYWGTGDERFDEHLARHLLAVLCAESLREQFCQRLAAEPEQRQRWVSFWCWRGTDQPADKVASLVETLDEQFAGESPAPLGWRQVLDLTAIFDLAGRADLLAEPLHPDSALVRYRQWRQEDPDYRSRINRRRPSRPFAT